MNQSNVQATCNISLITISAGNIASLKDNVITVITQLNRKLCKMWVMLLKE